MPKNNPMEMDTRRPTTIDQSGVILSCNAATERMFGYRSEDMLGRNVSMLMPGW